MPSDKLVGRVSKLSGGSGQTGGPWANRPIVNKQSQSQGNPTYMPGIKGSVSASKNPKHVSDVTRDATGGGIKSMPLTTHVSDSAIGRPRVATGPFTRGSERRHSSSAHASERPYGHRGRNKKNKARP
jgi:hypothetical protein